MEKVIGPEELTTLTDEEKNLLTDVSRNSTSWTRLLSPEHLGPVNLYACYKAATVENGYQYTKVFNENIGALGLPTKEYIDWAEKGWKSTKVDEILKEKEPLFYYWHGKKYNKLDARRFIFIPLYTQVVMQDDSALERLKRQYYKKDKKIVLYDDSGYDSDALGMSYQDVIKSERPFSHAFILAWLLKTTV
jgi:hypothetical protein